MIFLARFDVTATVRGRHCYSYRQTLRHLEVHITHLLEGVTIEMEPVELWSDIAKDTGNQIQKQNTETDLPSHQVLPP